MLKTLVPLLPELDFTPNRFSKLNRQGAASAAAPFDSDQAPFWFGARPKLVSPGALGRSAGALGALNECANLGENASCCLILPSLESFLISGLFWNGDERGLRAYADDRADRERRKAARDRGEWARANEELVAWN